LENLSIKSKEKSPEIFCNAESGDLVFKGKSIPENAALIYKPVIEWATEYIKSAGEETNLHLDLEYFNTASSIWIAKLIKVLSEINNRGRLFVIHIYFDIEDFDEMDEHDLAEVISPVTESLSGAKVSMGIKVYGKDESDSVIREKLILL
jgi:hypothetical protein